VPKSTAVNDLKVQIINVDVVPIFERTQKPLLYTGTYDVEKRSARYFSAIYIAQSLGERSCEISIQIGRL
jgi:hypothetical protein